MNTIKQLSIFIFLIFSLGIASQPNYPLNPEKAIFYTDDMANFLEVYENLTPGCDTIGMLQKGYLDKASAGLKEFIQRFGLTSEMIEKAIKNSPERYDAIRSFHDSLDDFKSEYILLMNQFQEVLPDAMFAPTYFLIGANRGLNQASFPGQLLSVEKKLATDKNLLKNIIIHELTHFQQAMLQGPQKYIGTYSKPNNMLDLILREGTADFVSYYLMFKNEEAFVKLRNYEKDEVNLWAKFQKDLEIQEKDYWLNVSFEDNNKGVPIQMGYAIGYKIVKSYYENATDKKQALKAILIMEDPQELLKKSVYNPSITH